MSKSYDFLSALFSLRSGSEHTLHDENLWHLDNDPQDYTDINVKEIQSIEKLIYDEVDLKAREQLLNETQSFKL